MNNTLSIPLYMKSILLKEICRRMDIIGWLNRRMGLELEATKKFAEIYQGLCPFCRGKKKRFFCDSETGYCACDSCWQMADFFKLAAFENNGDADKGMRMLVEYLRTGKDMPAQGGSV